MIMRAGIGVHWHGCGLVGSRAIKAANEKGHLHKGKDEAICLIQTAGPNLPVVARRRRGSRRHSVHGENYQF